jgi:steroid 5-alpha reductase family enzyme
VCEVGLWRASSHHLNYFFEWCVWLGYAVAGLAYAPWGLVALAPQAIILASIFVVTGIPPTENQAIRNRCTNPVFRGA